MGKEDTAKEFGLSGILEINRATGVTASEELVFQVQTKSALVLFLVVAFHTGMLKNEASGLKGRGSGGGMDATPPHPSRPPERSAL